MVSAAAIVVIILIILVVLGIVIAVIYFRTPTPTPVPPIPPTPPPSNVTFATGAPSKLNSGSGCLVLNPSTSTNPISSAYAINVVPCTDVTNRTSYGIWQYNPVTREISAVANNTSRANPPPGTRCLNVSNSSTQNGANIIGYPCDDTQGDGNDRFTIENGRLRNVLTGKCINVSAGGSVTQQECATSTIFTFPTF
ncbi:Protein containing Ricin B, lectin domain [Orpheovirus IHUMI-LCC2]|uniref:Protein containing Ricin B, lectin domain n=1 Tax=Orpheovirus IHUMI-LCC2 TaxID=2023057 RepID=A0A2I2L637_9VIRU|nr:Protein containing Ricin B, lectin domain [Orpheovirus IHUMI-LCC2]SNW62960.1 Protein containing Ricin B, lectin domain [Orpheovirus IHUMI-LCC2]